MTPRTSTGDTESDARLHLLIEGELTDDQRVAVLHEIANDSHLGHRLDEMLRLRAALRNALGQDRAAVPSPPAITEPSRRTRWIGRKAGLGLAAAIALAVLTGVVGLVLQTDHGAARRVAMTGSSATAPSFSALPPARLRRAHTLWRQVARDARPWLLINNDQGEFGSLGTSADTTHTTAPGGGVLLLRWRVIDSDGTPVHDAQLVLPQGQRVRVDLPKSLRIDGNIGALEVAVDPRRTRFGLMLTQTDLDGVAASIGVSGTTATDGRAHKIGEFRMGAQTLRVYVQSERLPGWSV